ncbi:SA1788 family PVL leukocidin-associated protein [Staphylococcus aureus]|uniref:SA1788 family PVL leukocidin-associated protein n=1 Tax=Staphylococcus aureus TaxID=1280 RepID=UPI001BFE2146
MTSKNKKRKYEKISQFESECLEKNGITKRLFYERVTRGWSREDAMTKPTKKRTSKSEEEKKLMTVNGIDDKTFRQRVYRKMDRKEAATRPKRRYNYKKD